MKSYTDIEQSKKLAEILPIESADMFWMHVEEKSPKIDFWKVETIQRNFKPYSMNIPCWSLAALLDVLPLEVETHKQTDGHKIYYYVEAYIPPRRNKGKEIYLSTVRHENLVDACVEMIFTLKQRNLL